VRGVLEIRGMLSDEQGKTIDLGGPGKKEKTGGAGGSARGEGKGLLISGNS